MLKSDANRRHYVRSKSKQVEQQEENTEQQEQQLDPQTEKATGPTQCRIPKFVSKVKVRLMSVDCER